jgi:hypothetical protein
MKRILVLLIMVCLIIPTILASNPLRQIRDAVQGALEQAVNQQTNQAANPFIGEWVFVGEGPNWDGNLESFTASLIITENDWVEMYSNAMDHHPPGRYTISENRIIMEAFAGGGNFSPYGTGTATEYTLTIVSGQTSRTYHRTNVTVPGTSFAEKLQWLQTNAGSGAGYIIEFTRDESINTATTISLPGRTSVGIHLKGIGGSRIISFVTPGRLFLDGGVHLVLAENIAIVGGQNRIIRINGGAQLTMRDGVSISGGQDGAVYVYNGGFSMYGGEIHNNRARIGAGVHVAPNGSFVMYDGIIRDNVATEWGGGISIDRGASTWMSGGLIRNNRATRGGAGINVEGTLHLSNGRVNVNTTEGSGGGIRVTGTLNMRNGTIASNNARNGGGIAVGDGGTVTMQNGENFVNRATESGGGVHLSTGSRFVKTGGTIQDSNMSDNGKIVGGTRRRDTAAGIGTNLDSAIAGSAGGWETNFTGTWRIVGRNGMHIHVQGQRRDNGAALVTWPSAGGANSHWRFDRQDDGTYIITNVHSGRAMDIQNHNSNDGVRVHQWERRPAQRSQRWHIEESGEFVVFINALSNRVLDIPNNTTDRDRALHQWTRNNSAAQQFRLMPIN